jgi:hypothetical protein
MLQVMPMKSSYLGKSATHGLALGTLWVAKSEMAPAGSLIENAFRRRHRRRGDCRAFPACGGASAAKRSREGGERPGDAAHAPLGGTPRAPSERRGRCPPVTGRAGRRPLSPVGPKLTFVPSAHSKWLFFLQRRDTGAMHREATNPLARHLRLESRCKARSISCSSEPGGPTRDRPTGQLSTCANGNVTCGSPATPAMLMRQSVGRVKPAKFRAVQRSL